MVDAGSATSAHKLNARRTEGGYTLRSEDSRDAARTRSHLKREPAAYYADHYDGDKLGLEQFNHPFGQLFIVTTLRCGLLVPCARGARG